MMREQLGPSMARTLVGDNYSTDYNYFLDTDDAGMHLTVVHRETGESKHIDLKDTEDNVEHPDVLAFDTEIEGKGMARAFLYTVITLLALGAILCVGVVLGVILRG